MIGIFFAVGAFPSLKCTTFSAQLSADVHATPPAFVISLLRYRVYSDTTYQSNPPNPPPTRGEIYYLFHYGRSFISPALKGVVIYNKTRSGQAEQAKEKLYPQPPIKGEKEKQTKIFFNLFCDFCFFNVFLI